MLVLFETPAGFAVFKLLNEKKLQASENLYKDFETPELASKIVKLKHFQKFKDTTEALSAALAAVEGKMSKGLKKMLKKLIVKEAHEQLAVADAKLGSAIKEKLNLSCVSNTAIQELMRCLRSQMDSLITGLPRKEVAAMSLGLAHSLSRYKLKFSPDKVDTMIVQAVSLLDDLDKELNNYVMRTREWYGWHFPELGKIVTDNFTYIKTVKMLGMKEKSSTSDMSDVLSEELEQKVKEAAEISMGTEITDEDIENIHFLCDQVIDMTNYRSQLYDYLQNRMMAIAPNLTVLVGELVGARLISHAGSLINLAKHPASTVQILGAEKALFRALKTKHDTPKYGLIYHAQLIGQSSLKLKGKMSRMLAGKAALACRVDALGEDTSNELGIEHRAKLEIRLKELEEGTIRRISGTGRQMARNERYESKTEIRQYPAAADSTLPVSKKRLLSGGEGTSGEQAKKKKVKTETVASVSKEQTKEPEVETPSKKKAKKKKKRTSQQAFSGQEKEEDGGGGGGGDEGVTEETVSVEEATVKKPKKKKKKLKPAVS